MEKKTPKGNWMLIFLKTIGLKNILLILLIVAIASYFRMQKHIITKLENDLTINKNSLVKANEEIKQQEEIFNQTVEAYEKTIIVQNQITKEVATTTEQKEKVAMKYQTLIKEVAQRGEIKLDEKDDFTIVEF